MHLIPNPRAYQALDGAFTLQDGEKVKSELRIPLVRTTTREARIITMRCNPCVFWRIMISAGVRCPAAAFTMPPVGVGAV